jgi:hypothetical protein
MSARDKFQVGQQVRMTEEGIRAGLGGLHGRIIGTVTGFSRDAKYVRIYRHGDSAKLRHTYAVSFWEVDDTATVEAQQ